MFIHFLGGEIAIFSKELYGRSHVFLILYQNQERVILNACSCDDRDKWVSELKVAQVLFAFGL